MPLFENTKEYQNVSEKIIQSISENVILLIKNKVIRNLQRQSTGLINSDTLKNMWDEICVITQDGSGDFNYEIEDTIDNLIEFIIDTKKISDWQLCSIWLIASEGQDWNLDNDQDILNPPSFIYNLDDIKEYIRKEYILSAAMGWSNVRISKFQDAGYETEDDFY